MSEEQLKAFLKKVKGDTSLQKKLKAAAIHLMLLLIVDRIHAAKALQLTAEDNIKMQSATVELSELVEGHNGTVLHHGSDPSQIKIRPSTSTYPSTSPPIREPRPAKMTGDGASLGVTGDERTGWNYGGGIRRIRSVREMEDFGAEELETTPAEW